MNVGAGRTPRTCEWIDVAPRGRDPERVGIKRLIGGLFVCSAAVIAACFGGAPRESAQSELLLQAGTNSYDFGTVPVGMTGSSGAFLITAQGLSDDDTIIDIYESCGDFGLVLNPAPQGYRVAACEVGSASGGSGTGSSMCVPTSYSFSATFTPTSGFPSSCTVHVDYMPTAGGLLQTFPITLNGTGMTAANSLTLSPPSGSTFPYFDIPVGQTSSGQTVTVTNNGTNALDVTASVTGSYVVTGLGSASYPTYLLGAGSSANYDVRCQPTVTGPQPGSLTFSAPATPPVSLDMTCNGLAPTSLTVSPSPATFGSTLIGRPPANVPVTINAGGSGTTLSVTLTPVAGEVTIVGTNPDGQSLGSGSAATVTLHYSAATAHQNGLLATLTVNGQAVAVTGEALNGTLGVSPGTTIDFGPVCVGASVSQPVSLYASDAADLTVTAITPPAAPFTATATQGLLQGSHANQLQMMAGVAPAMPGELTGSIVVHTDLVQPAQNIALLATALPAGVSPTPDTIHFGSSRTLMTTSFKEVIVSNCGTTPITFASTRIEGASAADFAVVSELPTAPLAQRASTKILVVMTPHSNGAKQAQLFLEHDGGVVTVDLDGAGFGGTDDNGGGKNTYYSNCNAGGASGLGGSLAVLVLALRRRRRA